MLLCHGTVDYGFLSSAPLRMSINYGISDWLLVLSSGIMLRSEPADNNTNILNMRMHSMSKNNVSDKKIVYD